MPRIARNPLLVSLSLSIATALLVLCCLSPAKEHFGRSRNELDKGFPLFHFAYEMEEHGGKIGSDDEDGDHINDLESCGDPAKDRSDDNDNEDYDDDDDDDDDDADHGSDGYDEDDDDSGSYAEMGWEDEDDDEEECDSELERRVEAFIAKVINGWREEWFSDNMQA